MADYPTYYLEVFNIEHNEFNGLCRYFEENWLLVSVYGDDSFVDPQYYNGDRSAEFHSIGRAPWAPWCDCHKDMLTVAGMFPNALFCLKTYDGGYSCCDYYRGDKHEHCEGRVVFDESTEIEWEDS